MRICFFRQQPSLPSLSIGNHHLGIVTSHKVLGLTFQNDLKWGSHIDDIVRKASKRLYIIRVLGREGVPPQELKLIYIYLLLGPYQNIVALYGTRACLNIYRTVWKESKKESIQNHVSRFVIQRGFETFKMFHFIQKKRRYLLENYEKDRTKWWSPLSVTYFDQG